MRHQALPAKNVFAFEGRKPMGIPPIPGGNPDAAATADWTIMLYIAADSSLANFAVESLKQLNRSVRAPAETEGEASVVVAAQFSIDAPGGQEIQRYIFEKGGKESLRDNKKTALDARDDLSLSEQGALESFLRWVYEKSPSNYYALILWSHGPELFLQPPPGGKTGDSASLYLTPGDLRDALIKSNKSPTNHRKLEIVGFDACSMSMFEMAYEIKDLAKLMIASQEEVPDASFPYSDLVQLFRKQGKDVGSLLDILDAKKGVNNLKSPPNKALAESLKGAHEGLENGVRNYLSAYQDYIVGKPTGMNPVTLSVLNLTKCDGLKDALDHLACALRDAKNYPELPRRLIQARKNSQDYAGGLYVDLYEFCKNLEEQLKKAEQLDQAKGTDKWKGIKEACQEVQRLLEPPDSPTSSSASPISIPTSLILINGAVTETGKSWINEENKTKNHGISIYLPYLTNRQFDDKVNRPLVKGGRGTNGGKGIPNLLNGAAGDYLMSTLQSLILTTESYYGNLKLAADTAWYSFITDQWTKAINETDPDPKFHYSARQIEINLCPKHC
jgi:hypothetical protein